MSAIRLQSKEKAPSARKEKWERYVAALKYAKYVCFHPFDGFWDLAHEKKGSIAAATTFLVLFLVTHVLKLMYTNFQFVNAPLQYINVFEQAASLLLPFLILCLGNWSLTTLFDGKGRFGDIYTAMCYALVPFIVIQLPLALAFIGLMQVHDYSPGKTLVFLVATVLAASIIIFLMLVFFSLLSDLVSFFVSVYREIAFRLY